MNSEVQHGHVGEEKERGGLGERNRVIHIQPPTLVHLSGNEILSGLETVVETVYQWCYLLVSEVYQSHYSTLFELMTSAGAQPFRNVSQDVPLDRYIIQEKS